MLNFRKGLKLSSGFTIDLIPLVNVLFLAGMFYLLSFHFTRPAPISVKLPRAVTSDIIQDKVTIVITGENIIYYDGKVTTLRELRSVLLRPENRDRPVFIKADKRASVGRIVDVWDLSRGLGIRRVDVATD